MMKGQTDLYTRYKDHREGENDGSSREMKKHAEQR